VRYLAIGDIHGCFTALTTLAEFVPFHVEDTLITLGDHVDRGPDTRSVIDWLIAWREKGNLVALRGNHEVMMLAARVHPTEVKNWLGCGGDAALASYFPFPDGERLADIPEAHWRFLNSTGRTFQTATHFFVHANALPDYPLDEQPDYMLYWEFFNDPPPHQSGKIMVCGHTPQKAGVPRNIGHAVCIDTGPYRGGWLTCLDVGSGRYWQANQQGETRDGWLDDL
jgi:serine/threonine protein phosphatase 1